MRVVIKLLFIFLVVAVIMLPEYTYAQFLRPPLSIRTPIPGPTNPPPGTPRGDYVPVRLWPPASPPNIVFSRPRIALDAPLTGFIWDNYYPTTMGLASFAPVTNIVPAGVTIPVFVWINGTPSTTCRVVLYDIELSVSPPFNPGTMAVNPPFGGGWRYGRNFVFTTYTSVATMSIPNQPASVRLFWFSGNSGTIHFLRAETNWGQSGWLIVFVR